ncbi:MBL fold metallo-hydrolase [Calditrichota bacterium]
MQIGKFKITSVDFGRFRLDGGAMFGVVPRVLWQRQHPPDEKNTINMALRCLLIEVENRKILVDTGFGAGRSEKFRKMFSYTGADDSFVVALNKLGVTQDDITDVILTHLHFDHTGGSTINKETEPIPAYPNATYYFQHKQLEHARSRLERDKASYLAEDFEPLIEHNVAEIWEGDHELLPGLDTIVCNGHTPGMQLVRVRDGGQTVVYGADLVPLASQFSLPWIMSYDLYPVTTLEEKKILFEQSVAEDWLWIFEHDADHVTGKIAKTDKGFELKQEA